MASSSIVIKVRYGDMLRRLNVSINDKKLVLDMIMLKEKIRSLFSFGTNVEFTMTYVDEDGDTVTLADDDDLHDVVRQSLNPVRITVSLNNSNSNGSSGNSTPVRFPQNHLPFQTLNSGVSEILKSVPEPLLQALAKLPLDLASKASPSSPVVSELVENLKDVYSNQILPYMASPRVLPAAGGPPNVKSESPTVVSPEARGSNTKKKEKQVQKVTEGLKFKDVKPPRGMDLNVPYFESECFQAPSSSTNSVGEGSTGKNKNTSGVDKKKDSSFEKKDDPLSSSRFIENINQVTQQLQDRLVAQYGQVAADINKKTNDSGSSSGWAQEMLSATNRCPFSGMSLASDTNSQGRHFGFSGPQMNRFRLDNNGMGNIFHRNVSCDGCGVHPITGPRYKSKVKDDYDLCNACFEGMGNATDYIRIDRPINGFKHLLTPFKGFNNPSPRIPPPMLPHLVRIPGPKPSQSELDSRFILDVNVLDGTIMAPLTLFTKIWRMRNNGSIIWPCGSQLQWIGGDRLSNSDSVDVEIPVDGLHVDKEIDIAVTFTAPELPGRYVSYWRMASPSGQKFGQRLWVSIQVDASMKNAGDTLINLNLPPVMRDLEAVNQDYLPDNMFCRNDIFSDYKNTSVDLPPKDHEMSFPDNGGVASTVTTPVTPAIASSSVFNSTEVGTALGSTTSGLYPTVGLDTEPINYPTVDISVLPPIMSSGAASLPTEVVPPLGSGGRVISDEEEDLVKYLEQMGFKRLDLNKEILRLNNYDLEKSIDDLCGVLEWDPMLDELQEMGFVDDETNWRLLKKNNGSIKRVVMDLINEERA
ncbi:hypothetical protein R6Q59_028947 [Mikania micrantha]